MMSPMLTSMFRLSLPWFRRREAKAEVSEQVTQEAILAAKRIKKDADEIIRAAYALSDARARERTGGGG